MATLRIGLCVEPGSVLSPSAAQQLGETDILIFPEMMDSGYAALKAGALPHKRGDDFLARFAAASASFAPYCIAGSVYLQDSPRARSNTSLVFHRGRLIHRYDKIHLFRPAGDHGFFSPGKRIGTFRVSLPGLRVRCGVIICYDLRFPELVRAMALQGLDVLFVPSRWPSKRDDAWQTLLKARAIENQIFVVGCNARGEEGGWSYVFDPLGAMVFDGRSAEGDTVHALVLDLDRIGEAQKLHKNLNEAVVLRSSRLPRTVTALRRVK